MTKSSPTQWTTAMPADAKLKAFIKTACERRIIDDSQAMQLNDLAAESQRESSVSILVITLSVLGAMVLGLGVILFIASNWIGIPDLLKIFGFVMLFAAAHGFGMWLRIQTKWIILAESMNLLGGLLFIAGVGLVGQIYQLEGHWNGTLLLWLISAAPLAWLLRSPSLTLLSLLVTLAWMHSVQVEWFSYRVTPGSIFLVDVAFGVALIGLSARIRDAEPTIAWIFRGVAVTLLVVSIYVLGFYHYMSWSGFDWTPLAAIAPAVALLLAGGALAIGYGKMMPGNPYLKNRLLILFAILIGLGLATIAVDAGLLPRGPRLEFFNFGWTRAIHLFHMLLAICWWAIWFGLGTWCIFFAARTGRTAYLNIGVMVIGVGVITRFFDLVGSQLSVGIGFIAGGSVLIGVGFAMEFCRRNILRTLKESDETGETLSVEPTISVAKGKLS